MQAFRKWRNLSTILFRRWNGILKEYIILIMVRLLFSTCSFSTPWISVSGQVFLILFSEYQVFLARYYSEFLFLCQMELFICIKQIIMYEFDTGVGFCYRNSWIIQSHGRQCYGWSEKVFAAIMLLNCIVRPLIVLEFYLAIVFTQYPAIALLLFCVFNRVFPWTVDG